MSRYLARAALSVFACLVSLSSGAQPPAGRYIELRPPQPTNDPSRIVVAEFFSYQCPHCFSFLPALDAWVRDLPEDVSFERVAVSIGHQPWVPIARAFYALQAMEQVDALDTPIFRAIHVHGVRLLDEAAVTSWVAEQGVDRAQFSRIYGSFSVDSFLARGEQLARTHRIPSVPALVIDGRFVVPIIDNNTFADQFASVDQLIARVRARRAL